MFKVVVSALVVCEIQLSGQAVHGLVADQVFVVDVKDGYRSRDLLQDVVEQLKIVGLKSMLHT